MTFFKPFRIFFSSCCSCSLKILSDFHNFTVEKKRRNRSKNPSSDNFLFFVPICGWDWSFTVLITDLFWMVIASHEDNVDFTTTPVEWLDAQTVCKTTAEKQCADCKCWRSENVPSSQQDVCFFSISLLKKPDSFQWVHTSMKWWCNTTLGQSLLCKYCTHFL